VGWQELTGKHVCVSDELVEVVHVDAFRVVMQTVPRAGGASLRLVISPDEVIDFKLPEEQGRKE